MEAFSIGKVYKDKNGCKAVNINPLPKGFCSFDCVFCPLGRTDIKTEEKFFFDETKDFINKLSNFLDSNDVEIVFINPDGESMANEELIDIIKLIKDKGRKVKLLSNGYLLNKEENKQVLELCDEVIGELAVTNEKYFQKLQRPLEGYTLEKYIDNVANFKKWFKGKFILDITIIKNYSDTEEAINLFKEIIKKISPDEVFLETPDEDKFKGAFEVNNERLNEIRKKLCI